VQREQDLERRLGEHERQRGALAEQGQKAQEVLARAEARHADVVLELQRVAGLTADEARADLVRQMEHDARRDAAHLVKRLEAEGAVPTPSSSAEFARLLASEVERWIRVARDTGIKAE